MSDTQKHTKPNVPNLRFPEFDDNWQCFSLDELAPGIASGRSKPSDGRYALIGSTGIIGTTDKAYYTGKLILVARVGANAGYINYFEGICGITDNTLIVKTKDQDEAFTKYIYYYLNHEKLNKLVFGSGQPLITGGMLKSVKVFLGGHKEVSKISHFLSLIDKRIAIQSKVIEDLKNVKNALCELFFDASAPNCRIGDIIEQVSERNKKRGLNNVLSVSNRYGFIEQSKQFEDRTVASEDTSNYKIVSLNDFAYNPARINVGSIARLKHFSTGIISPMYICFRTRESVIPEYLESFFDTKYFSLEMGNRLEGSVRMCLSYEGLCNIPIYIPSLQEQKAISTRIETLKQKLFLEESILEKMLQERQYLLAKLFT